MVLPQIIVKIPGMLLLPIHNFSFFYQQEATSIIAAMKIKSEISFQFSNSSLTDASVDQQNPQSLEKWCLILGVTKEELLAAIREHGHVIRDIRRGLRQKKKDRAA